MSRSGRINWQRYGPYLPRSGLESGGPGAVGFDDLIDLGHDADGFAKGHDDLLVVGNVLFQSVRPFRSFSHLWQTW